ncbi:MAG: ABC transporter permease, partial [Nitrospirota bacterium]|nr:ABC transporter permease [Nitrospirota bacterium]
MMLERLGGKTLSQIQEMGRMLMFLLTTCAWLARPPFRPFQMLKQLHFIGFKSMFVVVLTAMFTGMVLGLQGYYT